MRHGLRALAGAAGLAAALLFGGLAAPPASAQTEVAAGWSLIPSGLGLGDRFRLLIVTSTTRDAQSAAIADYDAHVQSAVVNNGPADIRSYSTGFKVLGSTETVNARDHTETRATDTSAPIYYLNGAKVADDYAGLYDGGWDSDVPRDESGSEIGEFVPDYPDESSPLVWTGTDSDGTTGQAGGIGRYLGVVRDLPGLPKNPFFGAPIYPGAEVNSNALKGSSFSVSLYGLSEVFVVAEGTTASADATLSALTLSSGTLSPTFSSDVTTYTASVGDRVSRIKVTGTAADDANASVAYLDVDGNPLMDAGAADGHQVDLDVGDNVIQVKVTAEDTTTTETYTVTVTRAEFACTAPDLSGRAEVWTATMTVGVGDFGDLFGYYPPDSAGTLSDTTFDYRGSSYIIREIQHYPGDSLDIYLNKSIPAVDRDRLRLHVCGDTFDLASADDETGDYFSWYDVDFLWSTGITVSLALSANASSDATLSDLTLSDGMLSPSFDPDVTDYTASAANAASRITVTAARSDSAADIDYLDGDGDELTDLDPGTDGHQVDLVVGENVIQVKLTAEDGTTTKTYKVTVTRAAGVSTDATLSALTLSKGTLSPAFSSDVIDYAASVGDSVSRITVTAARSDSAAELDYLDGDGDELADLDTGTDGHQVDLVVGANTIKVKVTAGDATTTKTYTVTVTRAAQSDTDATLSAIALADDNGAAIALSPSFASNVIDYRASVPLSVGEITITVATRDSAATVQFGVDEDDDEEFEDPETVADGYRHRTPLSGGDNVIQVKVTAGDGTTTKTYTVTVRVSGTEFTCTPPDLSGRTEVWTGTLTVGSFSGLYGYSSRSPSYGALSDTSFDYRENSYTIGEIYEYDASTGTENWVVLNLDPYFPNSERDTMRLHLCNDTFDLGEAGGSQSLGNYAWSNAFLDWSLATTIEMALTADNVAPVFEDGATASRGFDENLEPGEPFGTPVIATDDETLVYSLEGTDAALFDIGADGVLLTRAGESYDHETKSSYEITVKADDGKGETATIVVTVNVGDVDEPPEAPAEPTVTPVAGSTTSLSVTWTEPANKGPDIDGYDLRYKVETTSGWTDGPEGVTATTETLTGLAVGTSYEVQVRAVNAEGDGQWSVEGTGMTGANTPAMGQPSISGVPQVGRTLTAAIGTIEDTDGRPGTFPDDYGFQWVLVDGGTETDISGETSSTYTPAPADVGKTIKVEVSFTDDAGIQEGPLTSDATAAVTAACAEVWCATLTVQSLTGGHRGCANSVSGKACSNTSHLTEDEFTHGTGYAVTSVQVRSGGELRLFINPDLTTATQSLVLLVGAERFAFAHADTKAANSRYWNSSGLSWTSGATVDLKLVEASTIATLSDLTLSGVTLSPVFASGTAIYIATAANSVTQTTVTASRNDDGATVAIAGDTDTNTPNTATVNLSEGANTITVTVTAEDGTTTKTYTVTVTREGQTNTPATGKPSITGTAQVGETLTAATTGITDADGKTNADNGDAGYAYTYEWVLVDADGVSNPTDITGAIGSTYPPVEADVDKKVRVKVSFTDDGGTTETVTSDAYPSTGTIVAAGICGRTQAVQDEILDETSSISDCADVERHHLSAFTELYLDFDGITALAAGDFAGLTRVKTLTLHQNELTSLPEGVFTGLTSLEVLFLRGNGLTTLSAGVFEPLTALKFLSLPENDLRTLPAGVFEPLTALETLHLDGNGLTTLPAGVFEPLTALETLKLDGNGLTTLTAGVFEPLTALETLHLHDNELDALPAGVFDGLDALETLHLHDNELDALPAGVFEPLTALTELMLEGNRMAPFAPEAVALPDDGTVSDAGGTVTLDGSSSDGGPWGTNVTYGWALPDPASGVTIDDDTSVTPEATIPALTADTELTFTLTVTGRGGANGIAPGTDTATVRVTRAGNTAPTAADSSVTIDEDTAHPFAAAEFNFADTDPGDALVSVTVVTLPTAGALTLDGTAVTAGRVVPAADIGKLTFTPAANANGLGYASFTFRVSDGTDESASAYPMTVNVTAVNDPATGKPEISGTPQVGQPLTADVSGIMDADGLTNVSYTYQWYRETQGLSAQISGATLSTYTPATVDVGKTIKVEVSFTDDAGNAEDPLTSDATATVAAPGVTVSKTALTVTEQDSTGGSYTVVLDTEPTANVVVTVAGHAGTDVTPNPTTLTFTASNWDAAQTVTVTAGNDADTTDDSVALTHSAASADSGYSGIAIDEVAVTVSDNDTAQVTGVSVTSGNARLVTNWTAVDNATGYKVQWKSGSQSYNGNRQFTVTSGSTTSHTITGLVNGTEYTVRVSATRTGANDGPPAAEETGTPIAPGVTVSTTALTVTEQDSTGDGYTVVLDTEPTANVTVTVAGHAGTDVTPNPATLTFTSTTWSTAQTVTVTAGDDADTTDDSVALTHSAASADSGYSGIAIDEVAVTVSDNDTARVTGVSVTSGNARLVTNWTAVDNATGYKVQWKSGSQGYNTGSRQSTVTSGTTTSHTITASSTAPSTRCG